MQYRWTVPESIIRSSSVLTSQSIVLKYALIFQIISSAFCIQRWENNLLDLFVAIYFAVIASLPLILMFSANHLAHDLCIILKEFCKETDNARHQHKSASRLLILYALVVTHLSLTSCTLPFTASSDVNVLFLSHITTYLLENWLSELFQKLLMIPMISFLATCVTFSVLQCVLIVVLSTVGIRHAVGTCTSIKYYKKIELKMFHKESNIVFIDVLISAILVSSTLHIVILLRLRVQLIPIIFIDLIAQGGLCLATLYSICDNMGTIHESTV